MTRLFIRHSVRDYGTWRKAYDAFESQRIAMGVTDQAVFRSATDPGDVTIWHDFGSVEQAKAFADLPSLKEAMMGAGVVAKPDFWFTDRA
jgi:hypothetical protein